MEPKLIKFIDGIVGTPYKVNGRTREYLDCLGLVLIFYREYLETTILDDSEFMPEGWYDLPDYADYIERLIHSHGTVVREPNLGDIVLLGRKKEGRISHLGIYVGENKVLEAGAQRGVILLNLETIKELGLVRGYIKIHG